MKEIAPSLGLIYPIYMKRSFFAAYVQVPIHMSLTTFPIQRVQVIKGVRDGVHDVALKISTCKFDTNSEAFAREVALLKSCRNSNIVQVSDTT
jgi:hypothetical protein